MVISVRQNTDRIMTTHVGSLPRPHDLLDIMKARLEGRMGDEQNYESRVRDAVAACLRRQAETGIDIVCDGEQSKPGFFTYVRERLDGFETRPQRRRTMFAAERAAFPEYCEQSKAGFSSLSMADQKLAISAAYIYVLYVPDHGCS